MFIYAHMKIYELILKQTTGQNKHFRVTWKLYHIYDMIRSTEHQSTCTCTGFVQRGHIENTQSREDKLPRRRLSVRNRGNSIGSTRSSLVDGRRSGIQDPGSGAEEITANKRRYY